MRLRASTSSCLQKRNFGAKQVKELIPSVTGKAGFRLSVPPIAPLGVRTCIIPFYRWGYGGTEGASFLPKDTQRVMGDGEPSGRLAAALNPSPGRAGANPELSHPPPLRVLSVTPNPACPGITLRETRSVDPLLDLILNYPQRFIPAH